jgi:hypothetical protein
MSSRTISVLAAAAVAAALGAPPAVAASPGGGQARAALERSFPSVAAGLERDPTPPLSRTPDAFANDNALRTPTGNVVVSTMPLRARDPQGRVRPIDLRLAPGEEALAPRNAPFEAALDETVVGAFELGPEPGRTVRVTPVGAYAGTAPVVDDGGAFQASTHVATDSVVRLTTDGVETFEQLRGADAPERFAYTVQAPAGASIVASAAGGGLDVRHDGEVIVRMLPPVSVDAAGRVVPTAMLWDGQRVELVIRHRDAGYAYPILVDPIWTSVYDYVGAPNTGGQGISVVQEPAAGAPWYAAGIARGDASVAGIAIRPLGGRVYPEGASTKVIYLAPGTTRITKATFSHVSHFNDRHRQTMRLALFGNPQWPAVDRSTTAPGYLDRTEVVADPTGQSNTAQIWLFTPPCTSGEANCPRLIPENSATFLRVGAMTLELTDDDYPTFDATGSLRDMQGTWSNPTGDRTVELIARDGGSGMQRFAFTATDATGTTRTIHQQEIACDESHNTDGSTGGQPQGANICPYEPDHPRLAFDTSVLPEGRTTFRLAGEDFAENHSDTGGTSLSWDVFVDRTRPVVDASGPLRSPAGWINPKGTTTLDVGARDSRSGVRSFMLQVLDGAGNELLRREQVSCPTPAPGAAPCPTQDSLAVDFDSAELPEGTARFVVSAVDHVGNAAEPLTWTAQVDRTGPVVRADGDLTQLQDRWARIDGPARVVLEARDRGAGLSQIALEMTGPDGREEIAARAICAAGATACPPRAAVEFEIPRALLAEGRSTFTGVATDAAGNRSRDGESWDTYLDTTPPQIPAGIRITSSRPGSLEVSWERSDDGPGGSGVTQYEYRVTPLGQAPGQWQSTPTPGVTITDLPPGEVEILVRAVDEVGNRSQEAAGRFDFGHELVDVARPAGVGNFIWPPGAGLQCAFLFDRRTQALSNPVLVGFSRYNGKRERVFEPNTIVHAGTAIRCKPPVRKVLVRVNRVEVRNGGKPVELSNKTGWIYKDGQDHIERSFDAEQKWCVAGTLDYRLYVNYRADAPREIDKEGIATSEWTRLNCNEDGAFRSIAHFFLPALTPSSLLASDLNRWGKAKPRTTGFDAHHIVPADYKKYRDVRLAQQALYSCTIQANDAINGAWLRGTKYRRDKPSFSTLSSRDQARAYHPIVHTKDHFAWLRRKLTAHAGPGWCNKTEQTVELFEIYAALTLRGHAVPGVPRSKDK